MRAVLRVDSFKDLWERKRLQCFEHIEKNEQDEAVKKNVGDENGMKNLCGQTKKQTDGDDLKIRGRGNIEFHGRGFATKHAA